MVTFGSVLKRQEAQQEAPKAPRLSVGIVAVYWLFYQPTRESGRSDVCVCVCGGGESKALWKTNSAHFNCHLTLLMSG